MKKIEEETKMGDFERGDRTYNCYAYDLTLRNVEKNYGNDYRWKFFFKVPREIEFTSNCRYLSGNKEKRRNRVNIPISDFISYYKLHYDITRENERIHTTKKNYWIILIMELISQEKRFFSWYIIDPEIVCNFLLPDTKYWILFDLTIAFQGH